METFQRVVCFEYYCITLYESPRREKDDVEDADKDADEYDTAAEAAAEVGVKLRREVERGCEMHGGGMGRD